MAKSYEGKKLEKKDYTQERGTKDGKNKHESEKQKSSLAKKNGFIIVIIISK